MRASEDRIEERIEAGLRSYAAPPEIPETRIALAGILEQAREVNFRPSRRWIWALAAPLAAASLAAIMVAVVSTRAVPKIPEIARIPKAPATTAAPESRPLPERRPRIRLRVRNSQPAPAETESLPKLDVFPTPRPMTPEEQALSRATSTAPPQAIRALLDAQSHPHSPADLAELKVFRLDDAAIQDRRKELNLP